MRAIAAVILLPALLGAMALDLAAEVDRATVALGERLLLTVTATGPDPASLPQPRLPIMADFKLIGTIWGRFTSDPAADGESARRTVGFVFTLEPKRTGLLTIAPARLTFENTVYETRPITVRVVAACESVPPLERWTEANGITFDCSADRLSVYVGEQVVVTCRLFARTRVFGVLVKNAPSFSGFWAAQLDDTMALKWRPATRAGEPCSVAVVRRAALFPVQPGELTVGRMTLAGAVSVAGGLFKGMPSPFTVSSVPLTVTVLPLPEAGKPVDFGGGVGKFALAASLSNDRTENGEPVTLEVRVWGTGNIGTIGLPHVRSADGVKLLAPAVRQQMSREGGRIRGTCTYSYAIIPRADGQNVVPAISMSFFDPEGDTYYTLTTARSAFVATGATGGRAADEPASLAGPSRADIFHIKPSFSCVAPAVASTWWSGLFYPLGAIVLAAGAVTGRHRRRLKSDRGYALRSRARRLVRKRLRESARLLDAGDGRGFYAGLARAVIGYAGDRFNVEVTGLTGDELRTALCRRGADAAVVSRVLDFSSRCDVACFSPGATGLAPDEALALARGIIEDL